MTRLLVVGSGGREHALCWTLRRELPDASIFSLPGNPGTATVAQNLPGAATDLEAVAAAVEDHGIQLTIVGPEAPLADGLADHLLAGGHAVFGPTAAAARIESSKAFAKDVMRSAGVATAASGTFTDLGKALDHVAGHTEPLVVKASGLAAGKGAVICPTRVDARRALETMLVDGAFGDAGRTVVIEEFLTGEELSVFAITNGRDIRLLPSAQDHKRLLEGDQGPNTGGMGAYSPVRIATPDLLARVESEVLLPTLAELERRGATFRGVLYAGLMIGPDGRPSVVEFNCRLGDPEAQVVLPLVTAGLADAMGRAAAGDTLPELAVSDQAAVTTVLAAPGYPEQPERGDVITVPEAFPDHVLLFHAGTSRDADGVLRTAGGRVLAVTGLADDFSAAREASRAWADQVEFRGKHYRRDIGWREADR